MLYPFIRVNRAISSILIYPEHPIQAIAASEIISGIGPFLNPLMYKKILGLTIALMYAPTFSHQLLSIYEKDLLKYYQSEICFMLLFLSTYGIQYLNNLI